MNSLYSQKFNLKTCWVHLLNVLLKLQPAHLHSLCLSLEPHHVSRLLQQVPHAVGSLSLGLLRASLSPTEQSHSPVAWPTMPPLTWPLPPSRAHCPFWGQLLQWQGVCLPAPWCGLMSHTRACAASSLSSVTFFLLLFLPSYSSIKIQLRCHFLNPRLVCPFLDFCTF